MIRNAKKSTNPALQDAHTRPIHSAQSKPKARAGLVKPRSTAPRMLSSNVSITRRSKQKTSAGSQTATDVKVERQSSKCDSCSKTEKRSEDLESRIRSSLSQSGSRKLTSPTSSSKSSKSVKFDPAVIFCSDPGNSGPGTTQEKQFQAGVEAILKCKKSERQMLQVILDTLTKSDREDVESRTENKNQRTLNPRASIFEATSSLKAPISPKVVEGQGHASIPYAAAKRKPHRRVALDQSIFEPRASVQVEKDCQTPDENADHLKGLFANVHLSPLDTTCVGKGLKGKIDSPIAPRRTSYESVDFQKIHLTERPSDSGPGRVAVAMSPTWSQAILESFVQKYPMTGCLDPVMPVLLQSQRTAEVQQRLEFIIMQKKEMAALTGRLFPDDTRKWQDHRTDAGCLIANGA